MPDLTILLSPLNLLFFIIVTGFAIGRIRIKGISLGVAGILFAAILVGFLMNFLIPEKNFEITANAQSTLKTFSKLGTSLFVSVIGLQTGFSIKNNSKRSILSFTAGALMSISGVMVTLLISVLDKTISYPSLLGILCGALTSTTGLSSVCELMRDGSENAVLGYGSSYLLGVMLVVFFAQSFSRRKMESIIQYNPQQDVKSKVSPELILIGVTALGGNILGNITIEPLTLSFGTTASTLMVGLVFGYVFCKKANPNSISIKGLNTFRNLGLALFFTGTGFSTGTQAVTFDIKAIFYGALITITAIFCGSSLCKLVGTKYGLHKEFIIAGGMTSSPAYGAIGSKATETSINCFSFAYFGALVSLIILIQIISR